MVGWAYLELADITGAEFGSDIRGVWTRRLLIRRSIVDASLVFITWCPAGTPASRRSLERGGRRGREGELEVGAAFRKV